jgi:pterin-4a-carbinolamine dehydratase
MLGTDQITGANLTDWRKPAQGLHARLVIDDFAAGARFVSAIAEAGDALGHHPRLTLGSDFVDLNLVSNGVDCYSSTGSPVDSGILGDHGHGVTRERTGPARTPRTGPVRTSVVRIRTRPSASRPCVGVEPRLSLDPPIRPVFLVCRCLLRAACSLPVLLLDKGMRCPQAG